MRKRYKGKFKYHMTNRQIESFDRGFDKLAKFCQRGNLDVKTNEEWLDSAFSMKTVNVLKGVK